MSLAHSQLLQFLLTKLLRRQKHKHTFVVIHTHTATHTRHDFIFFIVSYASQHHDHDVWPRKVGQCRWFSVWGTFFFQTFFIFLPENPKKLALRVPFRLLLESKNKTKRHKEFLFVAWLHVCCIAFYTNVSRIHRSSYTHIFFIFAYHTSIFTVFCLVQNFGKIFQQRLYILL